MEGTSQAGRYNQPVQYGKTITVTTTSGETLTFTGSKAMKVQKYFEDNPRYIIILEDDGKTQTVYDAGSSTCGWCKVATIVPSVTAVDDLECEEGIGSCASISVTPGIANVEVGKTVTLVAKTVPASTGFTWASNNTAVATVANGVVTGVKAGEALITATSADGASMASVRIFVVPATTPAGEGA